MRNHHAAGEAQDGLDFSRTGDRGAQAVLWSRGLSMASSTASPPDAQAAATVRSSPTAFADASTGSAPADVAVEAGKPTDHWTDYGVGRTVRFNVPVFTGAPGTSTFSNQDVNGILGGSAWGASATAQTLTFSFPTSSTNYGPAASYGDPTNPEPAPYNGFQVLTDAQKNVVRYALGLIHSYTLLSFSETTETDTSHATLRYAGSSSPGTSYAYLPANRNVDGDAFFGNVRNEAPTKAGYAFDTFMHEIGHQMGLKHGQDQDDAHVYNLLPAAHNSTEWSIMTYYSYVGTPNLSYTNAEGSGNQTYMLDDIAALQYLYGANFSTNSGTTVYTWSPTTGEMFINGVGQGASSQNKVYETIWDGGGTDTYDLSNYTTSLTIDLRPGEWSTFSQAQLADLDANNPGQHLAHGNLANAHLYNNDLRSLIEIAKGGSGADTLIGNQGGNTLYGGGGTDTLKGLEGGDFLFGDAGHDTLIGGPGFDQMTGGADADTFYQYAGDSPIATPDLILDFQRGVDTLDVSGIGGGRVALKHNTAGTQTEVDYHYSNGAYTEAVLATGDVEGPDIAGDFGMSFYITGSSQADTLIGGAGADFIQGGDGADHLHGGSGHDTLTGDAGADVFELRPTESPVANPDVVTDFAKGTDKIGVYGFQNSTITLMHTSATATEVRAGTFSTDTDKYAISAFLDPTDIVSDQTLLFNIVGSSGADQLSGTALADTINGAAGDDVIRSSLGADTFIGGTGADTFDMFAGDSLIAAADRITDFERGIDNINVVGIPGGAVKLLHDGAGKTDVFYHKVSGAYTEEVIATGDVEAPDVVADSGTVFEIVGSSSGEGLIGGAAADTINGGGGNDVIRGGPGADTLTGGLGADTFNMFAGESTVLFSDTITDFQHGVDNINLVGIPGGKVGLNHLSATVTEVYYAYNTGSGSYGERVIATGDVEATDVVADAGTAFRIVGFSTGEALIGGDGADSIDGGGGNDIISGGLGIDTINGGPGNDTIRGGQGADILTGGADADIFNMFIGESTVVFSDTITDFQHGVDHINVEQIPGGRVALNHISATQTEVYYSYNGTSYGERVIATGDVEAPDVQADPGTAFRIVGFSTAETLFGGDAGDSIDAGGGDDVIRGGLGADTLSGGSGADRFRYYAGESLNAAPDAISDFLHGVDTIDVRGITGSVLLTHTSATATTVAFHPVSGVYTEKVLVTGDVEATDVLVDAGTSFSIVGSDASENLFGGAAADVINGAGGADVIRGGLGADQLTGGAGADKFNMYAGESLNASADTITDFEHGIDNIDLRGIAGGSTSLIHTSASTTVVAYHLVAGVYTEKIVVTGDVEATDIVADAGTTFSIQGGAVAETLVGGAAADRIQGGGGADTLTGGGGADIFAYASLADSTPSSFDVLADFQHGVDRIDLGAISGGLVMLFHTDSGTGTFYGYNASGGYDGAIFAAGDVEAADVIAAAGTGFFIVGGGLGETLVGGAAADVLQGNAGADVILGGGGADAIAGGDGADTFRYLSASDSASNAYDTIYDFQHGTDRIDLTGAAGPLVGLFHDGAGHTGVLFDLENGAFAGTILAYGDVEAADVATPTPTAFYISGSATGEALSGGALGDVIVGGGGADAISGGAGADVFLYSAVSDSPIGGYDYILDFQHGVDRIDLSAVDGGLINIVHPGSGASYVYYAPSGGQAQAVIAVVGDVELGDLATSAGATVIVTGGFSGPGLPGALHDDPGIL